MSAKSLSSSMNRVALGLLLLLGGIQAAMAYEVFDNDRLRFGTGNEASVNTNGNLQQPFYYDGSASQWYQLTYSNYPLDNAIGIDGDGTNDWNLNGSVVANAALTGQVLDVSGFTLTSGSRGYGTIVSTGTVTIGGKTMEMRNTYTLQADKSFVKIVTRLTNTSGSGISNVRLWVGTRDDYVGVSDGPTKTRGNLVDGAFVAINNAAEQSAALQISSAGTGVLFYSTSPKANTSINSCCSFSNAYTTNPASSAIQQTGDGSYALFVRMEDMANGESEELTWYYAAGELANLGAIVDEVAEEADPDPEYTVSAAAGSGGSISPASVNVTANATTAFTVTPDAGYSISSVSGCGGALSGNTYTTGAITAACSVTASFVINSYTVSPVAAAGGSISPATPQSVNHGATTSFTVTPDDAGMYVLVGGTCNASLSGSTVTTAAITGDCSVAVSFHAPLVSTDFNNQTYTGETTLRDADTFFTVSGGSGAISVDNLELTRGGVSESLDADDINAVLIDNGNGSYTFSADRSGRYEITFTDAGSGQQKTLIFTVLPQVAFASVQQPGASNQTLQAKILLDDDPVVYPVTIPYTVQGAALTTDLSASGQVSITAPNRSVNLPITPNAGSGEIIIQLAETGLSNAVLGGLTAHKVVLTSPALLPLKATLSVLQGVNTDSLVTAGGGNVTLSVAPAGAGYSYNWSQSSVDLGIHAATSASVNINPSLLEGVYPVQVSVTETGGARRTATAKLNLRVAAAVPTAYGNYYDANYSSEPHLLAICPAGGLSRVADCQGVSGPVYLGVPEGYTVKLGRLSELASWQSDEYGLAVEADDIVDENNLPSLNGDDRTYTHIGFNVDFEVSELAYPGESIPVVIPLPAGETIPGGAVWRKYSADGGWRSFVENDANTLSSAVRTPSGDCPWSGSDQWLPGLNAGDECLRIVIQDGGPNDEDGVADAVVRDPGSLAIPLGSSVLKSGSGGGGAMTLEILLGLILLWLISLTRSRMMLTGLLALVFAGSAAADERWYIGAGAGMAVTQVDSGTVTQRLAANGIPGTAEVSDTHRRAWKLFAGYQWRETLAFEAGYVDFGEITTRFSGTGTVTLNELRDIRPTSGTGVELAVVGRHHLSDRFDGYGRIGLLRWQAGYELSGAGGLEDDVEIKGTDLTFGLGLDTKLADQWSLRLGWDRYEIDGDESHLFALGIVHRFKLAD